MSSKYYRLDSERSSNSLMTRSEFRKFLDAARTESYVSPKFSFPPAIINRRAVSAAVCYSICLEVLSHLFPMFFYALMPGPR